MRLVEIAKRMKLEAYYTGSARRTLWRGLQLTLTPHLQGWCLKLQREKVPPSSMEYRVVAKAFCDARVKSVSQPSPFVIEILTK